MSIDFTSTIDGISKQAEAGLTAVQNGVVSAVGAAANTAVTSAPSLKALNLPTPKDVVSTTYDLVAQVTARQKQFTESLIDAVEPVRTFVVSAASPKV